MKEPLMMGVEMLQEYCYALSLNESVIFLAFNLLIVTLLI